MNQPQQPPNFQQALTQIETLARTLKPAAAESRFAHAQQLIRFHLISAAAKLREIIAAEPAPAEPATPAEPAAPPL